MDLRQLSLLLIKIAGLVIVAIAITAIPGYVNYYVDRGEGTLLSFFALTVIPLAFPVIIGVLMWRFPSTITNKILIDGAEYAKQSDMIAELERVVVTLLGLLIMYFALSDLVYNQSYISTA